MLNFQPKKIRLRGLRGAACVSILDSHNAMLHWTAIRGLYPAPSEVRRQVIVYSFHELARIQYTSRVEYVFDHTVQRE